MRKEEKILKTIGLRIYIFKGGGLDNDIAGQVVLLNERGIQIKDKMFNHSNELLMNIRKLVRESGYRKVWKNGYWEFEKKSIK